MGPVSYRPLPGVLGVACALALSACSLPTWSQYAPEPVLPEEALERLAEEGDGEQASRTAESLLLHILRPLPLNTASADELAGIPGLPARTALRIVLHRQRHGPFPSVDSLRSVPGVTEEMLEAIRPYLMLDGSHGARTARSRTAEHAPPASGGRRTRFEMIHLASRRAAFVQEAEGADGSRYAGGAMRMLTRIQGSGPRLSVNLTLDKDPGEAFGWRPGTGTYGYDFVSGHIALRNAGRVRRLVLGDFAAGFGQGLTLAAGAGFGKGGDPVRAPRRGAGLVPYRSSDEHRYFRGGGVTLAATPHLDATLFASRRKLDAEILPDGCSDTTIPCAAAPVESGLHRTEREIRRKHALGADVAGAALQFTRGYVQAGVTGYRHRYATFVAAGPEPFRTHAFEGRTATGWSLFGRWMAGEVLLFGEAAHGARGGLAGLGGVQAGLGDRVEALLLVRHYPARFASLYGDAFGERSGPPANEQGVYAGLRLRPHPHWTLEGYLDQYRFPWLRFGVPRPSTGHEALLRASYRPRRWAAFSIQGRAERTDEGILRTGASGHMLHGLGERTRQSLRAGAEYVFNSALRTRARLEWVRYTGAEGARERGLLLYHDLRWRLGGFAQLDVRTAVFDVSGFGARVYAFEQNVLYAFSAPAFTGRGERWYALLRLDPLESVTLQFRYGGTRHDEAGQGRSGATPRPRRDLHVLLRLRL